MANECKYQKKQYQISYDDGSTWYDAVPARYEKGSIIEYSSPDCAGIETQYRWRELEGQYICIDKDKYTKEIQEEETYEKIDKLGGTEHIKQQLKTKNAEEIGNKDVVINGEKYVRTTSIDSQNHMILNDQIMKDDDFDKYFIDFSVISSSRIFENFSNLSIFSILFLTTKT